MDQTTVAKTVGDAIWHRTLLIFAIAAVVVVAGAALYAVTPPTYETQAQVYVDPAADQALQQSDGVLLRDIAQQATSRRVLARAGLQLAGSPAPEQLSPHISAAVIQPANLVTINATAGSPLGAAELANSVAIALVAEHRANIAQRGLQSQTFLSGELTRLAGVIKTDQATGVSAEQQNLDRQEYGSTFTRLQDLQLRQTRASGGVSVGQQALAPDRPVNPDLVRYLGVSAVGGIFIALLVALLVERFDDRVFDSEAVANASGAPLVVVTPSSRRPRSDELPAQYTLAYAHIAARYPSARTIMVAASSHRESTDPVAAAFGSAAELAGDDAVVLQREPSANPAPVDASRQARRRLRASRPGTELSIVNDAPAGAGALSLPALAIMFPGLEAASGARAPRTFVAVPAPFLSPAAASLCKVVDVAIVVAVARATRIAEVVRTAECLRDVGVEPVAVVLVPKRSAAHNGVGKHARKPPLNADNIRVRPAEDVDDIDNAPRKPATSPRSASGASAARGRISRAVAAAVAGAIPNPPASTDDRDEVANTVEASWSAPASDPLDPPEPTRADPTRVEPVAVEPVPAESVAARTLNAETRPAEAAPAQVRHTYSAPPQTGPTARAAGEGGSARAAPDESATAEITTKANDLASAGNRVTARRGETTRTARVEKILAATPSAVKTKADSLARSGTAMTGPGQANPGQAGASNRTRSRTKNYRINSDSRGGEPDSPGGRI